MIWHKWMTPLVLAVLTGCPRLPPPSGCTPHDTRCSTTGVPEVCSSTQRWTSTEGPCSASSAVCCATMSPYGHLVHACTTVEICNADAGTQ